MNETTGTPPNNIQAAIDAGRALGQPYNLMPKDPLSPVQVVIVPKDYEIKAIEPQIQQYLDTPRRIKASVKLADADSFIRYVGKFKNEDTQIFATVPGNNSAPLFLGIIDYHTGESPEWCEHRAIFACQFTEEWNRWTSQNKKRMSQVEFATLLEENASLVVAPPGAELLELVTALEGKNNITCNSLVRLSNGRTKLEYQEEVELRGTTASTAGQIEFPTALTVAIAPFDGGPSYKINCRLRYRIENRKLIFWFECVDLHLIIKECVADTIETIQEKLGIEPLMGSPA